MKRILILLSFLAISCQSNSGEMPRQAGQASNEYFNVIDQKNFEGNILNTVFKEYRNGELKFISFNAKKARGLLAKFVINNKITRNKDLKDFDLENYKFDSSLSDDSTFVFTR